MALVAGLDAFTIAGGIICLFLLGLPVYRLYFHPLASYPGPRFWAISFLPGWYYELTCSSPPKISEIHKKYGPIVRVGPNSLSFILEDAWQDIYGKHSHRNTQLKKDTQLAPSLTGTEPMLTEFDDTQHARMRRNFASGFSEKFLRNQEDIIQKYINLLILRLQQNSEKAVDLVMWYNFFVFDVIGDLTFGDSFGCLETSESHFWIVNLEAGLRTLVYMNVLQLLPSLKGVLYSLFPKQWRQRLFDATDFIAHKVKDRMDLTSKRPDFMSLAQEHFDKPEGLTSKELEINAVIIISAGSTTTASLLHAVIYYLLTNPSIMAKVITEVRTAFKSEKEITMVSVNTLTYCLAALNETMRIYPPLALSFRRVTPPSGCTIAGKFVPGKTKVAVSSWSANRSDYNFTRPLEFLPERWLGDPGFANDKRKVVQPFSVGPRNCIGRNLAYAEAKIVLARMIWNFDMEIEEESKGWDEGQKVSIIWEAPPLMVKLKPAMRA